MNDQFATAMGRALEQTRAGNPSEATRILQTALSGDGPKRPRRPLGEVISSLVKARPKHRGGSVRPDVPDDAVYETGRHESSFGARDYRVFVPTPRAEPPQGLVLMLHGCTQDADDFATGTRMNLHAERQNLVVVYPEQTRQANQMGCWNWFRPEDQARGQGEPALLADLAGTLAAQHGVPQGRTYVAGLSAGAAMAAILGGTHPEVFAAVGVHSGLAPGSASDLPSALAAMRGGRGGTRRATAPVRSIVFHGTADATVAPRNADAVIAASLGGETTVEIASQVPGATVALHRDAAGRTLAEDWRLSGIGHAWSGGSPAGSYTHPEGPDASAEMVRFFLAVSAETTA